MPPRIPKIPGLNFNPLDALPRFGEQLHDYRTQRGLTIDQIAEASGMAPSAVRDLEAGKRGAPMKSIVKSMADALKLDKEERDDFLEAAEMDSPFMNNILGRTRAKTEKPALNAAIFAFLIADIRGYTHFTQERGDQAAAQLTGRFAELARSAVEQWDGQLVEVRGDEILAVFASARQAVQAAGDLQARYIAEAHAHPELPAGIGVGLDIGEAAVVDGGYRGAALNRAARLCSLAGPGEVLVSAGVVYVAPHVNGVTFQARGMEKLKGFEEATPILLAAPSGATAGMVDADDTSDANDSESSE